MIKKNKNKFWFENIECIFHEHHIFPEKKMTLESKMNSLTRFVMLIFIIILFSEIFNMKNNIIFLILSLFIIIILYYKQKKQMIENFKQPFIKEKYENDIEQPFNTMTYKPKKTCRHTARINYTCTKPDDEKINKIVYNQNRYNPQDDYNSREYNPNFNIPTDNQLLAGGPNPKTFVPPIISTPSLNHEFWKEDQKSTVSIINTKKRRFEKDSGYIENNDDISIDYSYPKNYDCKVKVKNDHKYDKKKSQPMVLKSSEEQKESFTFPYEIKTKTNENLNEEDSMYYKDFKNNRYFKDRYKENVFENIVAPGNYKTNNRNEPINSLIGINEPQTFEDDDSRIIEPYENVNMSNVYDPRFYGYGTSYREYYDKNVGQPRYYYDDVNAIKMPNYISRNNIDVTPFGDSNGAMNNEGNRFTANIHALADRHYNDSMMQFRTEMQDRLMRKVNAEEWQQKMFPIRKM